MAEGSGNANEMTIFKPMAYGLCGANFFCVMQFLYDSRVPPIALILLIVSIPPLIIIGVLFATFEEKPLPHPAAAINAELVGVFAFLIAATCSSFGYIRLFSAVKMTFALAFGGGIVLCLGLLSLVNLMLARGLKKAD